MGMFSSRYDQCLLLQESGILMTFVPFPEERIPDFMTNRISESPPHPAGGPLVYSSAAVFAIRATVPFPLAPLFFPAQVLAYWLFPFFFFPFLFCFSLFLSLFPFLPFLPFLPSLHFLFFPPSLLPFLPPRGRLGSMPSDFFR